MNSTWLVLFPVVVLLLTTASAHVHPNASEASKHSAAAADESANGTIGSEGISASILSFAKSAASFVPFPFPLSSLVALRHIPNTQGALRHELRQIIPLRFRIEFGKAGQGGQQGSSPGGEVGGSSRQVPGAPSLQLPSPSAQPTAAASASEKRYEEREASLFEFDWLVVTGCTVMTALIFLLLSYGHCSRWTLPEMQKCDIRVLFYLLLFSVISYVKCLTNQKRLWLLAIRSFYEAYVLYLLFYVMPVLFMGGETNTMTKLHIRHKLRDPRTYVLTTKLMFMFLMAFGPAVNLIHYAVQQRRGGEALWVEEALLILDILVMIAVLVNALQFWFKISRECRSLRLQTKKALVVPLVVLGSFQDLICEAAWGDAEKGLRFSGALFVFEITAISFVALTDYSADRDILVDALPPQELSMLQRIGQVLCIWDVFRRLEMDHQRFVEIRTALQRTQAPFKALLLPSSTQHFHYQQQHTHNAYAAPHTQYGSAEGE
ncbi:unnamed protein product [Vitrella brassicaformis CCMP3155]|uniref:Intimal thickness related receptor IRP domain-containing protein n=2 Tax=Vitrella brassicaformis TaxID=1169539 RepID=A0A0G4EC44_VITBC|nr:unnamed protein product [Vitrella brassicaformis CCMP3155]|eukprot:CEL92902.1 unnamed protein product [Vitrella brassicaformis CCMP3155]